MPVALVIELMVASEMLMFPLPELPAFNVIFARKRVPEIIDPLGSTFASCALPFVIDLNTKVLNLLDASAPSSIAVKVTPFPGDTVISKAFTVLEFVLRQREIIFCPAAKDVLVIGDEHPSPEEKNKEVCSPAALCLISCCFWVTKTVRGIAAIIIRRTAIPKFFLELKIDFIKFIILF